MPDDDRPPAAARVVLGLLLVTAVAAVGGLLAAAVAKLTGINCPGDPALCDNRRLILPFVTGAVLAVTASGAFFLSRTIRSRLRRRRRPH